MIVDTNDIQGHKSKGLKQVLGSQIFELFDISLTYDEDITRWIGVSFHKHWNMNVLQNFRMNDIQYQYKVKSLEFPEVFNQNKWTCIDQDEDLLDKLESDSVSVQELISTYYCKRSIPSHKNDKNSSEEKTRVKISPNRLSIIYKIAENVNFLRSLYIKNEDSLAEELDIIDGVIAIFFNELTAISDKTINYNDKQLLRSYCIERVMSRMEIRPFFELVQGIF